MTYVDFIADKYNKAFSIAEIGMLPKHEHFHKWHSENMEELSMKYEALVKEMDSIEYTDYDEEVLEEVKGYLGVLDENIDVERFWTEFPVSVDDGITNNARKWSSYMNKGEYSSFYFFLYLCMWLCSEHEEEVI